MNTTHLALSEPGGAPVTAGETSLLGRRRTRGLFIRQGERERVRNELTVGVEEVVAVVGPAGEATEDKSGDTFQSEYRHDRDEEPKEELCGAEK